MNIIEAVRAFLLECPLLTDAGGGIQIDLADLTPTSYALSSSGTQLRKAYLDGTREIQHSFVLYATNYTIEDAARLENSEFFELFDQWLWERNMSRTLPTADGVVFDSITCTNGMLYDLSEEGDIGTYQIQIQAIYTKGI